MTKDINHEISSSSMTSHKEEPNPSILFGDATGDDPFSQMLLQQNPVSEQAPSKEVIEENQTPTAHDKTTSLGDASSLFATGSSTAHANTDAADLFFSSSQPAQPNTTINPNASAANFFEQQPTESFFDGLAQPAHEPPASTTASLTQAFDPNTYSSTEYQQQPQEAYGQETYNQQQQVEYDPNQWIQFDPNVHYYYDDQNQVHYYDPNTNQEYDMSQYTYDDQGQPYDYQYDPQYAEYYAQQGYTTMDPNATAVTNETTYATEPTTGYTDGTSHEQQVYTQDNYDPNAYAPVPEQTYGQDFFQSQAAYPVNDQQQQNNAVAQVPAQIQSEHTIDTQQQDNYNYTATTVYGYETAKDVNYENQDYQSSNFFTEDLQQPSVPPKSTNLAPPPSNPVDKKVTENENDSDHLLLQEVHDDNNQEVDLDDLDHMVLSRFNKDENLQEAEDELDRLVSGSDLSSLKQEPVYTNPNVYEEKPVENKDVTVENKDVQVEHKDVPVENKDVPVENKDVPVENKDVPVENKDVQVESKDVPVENKDVQVENKDVQVVPGYEAQQEAYNAYDPQSYGNEVYSYEPYQQENNAYEPYQQENNAYEPYQEEKNAYEPYQEENNAYEPYQEENNAYKPHHQEEKNAYEPHQEEKNTYEPHHQETKQDTSYTYEPEEQTVSFASYEPQHEESPEHKVIEPHVDYSSYAPQHDAYAPQPDAYVPQPTNMDYSSYAPQQTEMYTPQQHDRSVGAPPKSEATLELSAPLKTAIVEKETRSITETSYGPPKLGVSNEPPKTLPFISRNQMKSPPPVVNAMQAFTQQRSNSITEPDRKQNGSPFTGYYPPYGIERSATVPPPMTERIASPRPLLTACPDPQCEGENKAKAKFCCECGRPLAGISRSTTPSASLSPGVFTMSEVNTIPVRTALDEKKDKMLESLKEFHKYSVLAHEGEDEKQRLALEYIDSRQSEFHHEKALVWNIVKSMIQYHDQTLGDG